MEIKTFTERVGAILKQRFPDREFDIQSDEGVIKFGEAQFGMGNLFAGQLQSPRSDQEFEQHIADHFERLLPLTENQEGMVPSTWEVAKPRLRLQLFHQRVELTNVALSFPFSKTVCSSIVIDSELGYAYVRKENAEQWGQSTMDLLEIAQQNLLEASKDMNFMSVPGSSPLVVIQTVDGYDAARILVPEIRQRLIKELTNDVNEKIYVGVPNRDFLIAWPTNFEPEIHRNFLQQIARDAENQPYPLCKAPLLVDKDTITPV